MSLRDILSPALHGERRTTNAVPELQRVFTNEMYEIFVGLYPGGLLGAMVHYRREKLRIMSRLGELENRSAGAWIEAALALLGAEGRGPFHWVRDAKLECQIALSLHDRAALKLAGVEVPKSAGRYREMFPEAD